MATSFSLTTPRVADVLTRLLADAERTRAQLRRDRPSPEAPRDSAQFWSAFRDVHLAVSPETGDLLYLLARSSRARSVVEFGTSFGVSTIYLAAAVQDNGGGLVVGTEFEASKATAAQQSLTAAGLDDLVEIRVGDALDTLRTDLRTPIDMVLLDGSKSMYLDVLTLLEAGLAPSAVVVADNAARSPAYLDYVRDGGGYLSLAGPGHDVEISLRLGETPP